MPSDSLDIFALLASHRDAHSFATGPADAYGRYHAHLSRALQATRRSLGLSGQGKPDLSNVDRDPRTVTLLLLSAERAYVSSLAASSPSSTTTTAHSSKPAKHLSLSRLAKASSYLTSLLSLPTLAAETHPVARAQTTVFHLVVEASRSLQRGADDGALIALLLALHLLEALAPKLSAPEAARAREWADRDVRPTIRYCAYRLRSSGTSQDLAELLAEHPALELAEALDVPRAVVQAIDHLPESTPDARRGATLEWLGQTTQVPSASLVRALALVQARQRELALKLSQPRRKGLLKAFDRVLAATDAAMAFVPASLASTPNTTTTTDGAENAVVVADYLAFVRAETVVRRDLHLAHHLVPSLLPVAPPATARASTSSSTTTTTTTTTAADPDARTQAKVVRLLGSVVSQLEAIGGLGAVERSTRGEAEAVELKVGWFRAVRLYHLATLHLSSTLPAGPAPNKTLHLLPSLLLLLRQLAASLPPPSSPSASSWPASDDPERVTLEGIAELERSAAVLEVRAKDALWRSSSSSSFATKAGANELEGKAFLDLAVNFVELDLRSTPPTTANASGTTTTTTTTDDDDDATHRSTTALSSAGSARARADEDEGDVEEEAPGPEEGGKKKGWLGGWFGRG